MIEIGYNQAELSWGAVAKMDEAEIRKVLQVIKDLGGSRVRFSVQSGTLAQIDLVVALCREFGLRPLMVVKNNKTLGYTTTPESFGAMCGMLAGRYGPNGVGAQKNTCSDFQLLNESNLSGNEPKGADPANFVKYLKAGCTAIKAVHTSSTVIPAGTTNSTDAVKPVEWYRQIIAAGGAKYFDAIAMHFYVPGDPALGASSWQGINDTRALLIASGLADKKIWITEVGVAYPFFGVKNLVVARDRLKDMINGIMAQDWTGPAFIYAAKDYKGGDLFGGKFGMVDVDYAPKSPVYEYAKTIPGTPSDPGDIVPPTDPTGLEYGDVGSGSLQLTWAPNPSIDGVTNYRIYSFGAKIGDTADTHFQAVGLTPGIEQSLYVTAVDAAGNESGPSNVVTPATLAPSGSQSSSQGTFDGSTVPPTFNQLGLGVYVSGGVALPNPPPATPDDQYLTVWPRVEQQRSPDHSFRITLAGTSAGSDRAAGAMVRMNADGTQGVAVFGTGGGDTDSLTIRMLQNGKLLPMAGKKIRPGTVADDLFITVTGNVYTAQLIAPGEVIVGETSWTDLDGVFGGATNLGVGMCWLHRRVHGIYYPPPGVDGWATSTVGSVAPISTNDWTYGVIDDDIDLVIATGSWEPFI